MFYYSVVESLQELHDAMKAKDIQKIKIVLMRRLIMGDALLLDMSGKVKDTTNVTLYEFIGFENERNGRDYKKEEYNCDDVSRLIAHCNEIHRLQQ